MVDVSDRRCENCTHFRPTGEKVKLPGMKDKQEAGLCVYNPPVVVPGESLGLFPRMPAMLDCSRFKEPPISSEL